MLRGYFEADWLCVPALQLKFPRDSFRVYDRIDCMKYDNGYWRYWTEEELKLIAKGKGRQTGLSVLVGILNSADSGNFLMEILSLEKGKPIPVKEKKIEFHRPGEVVLV